MSALPARRRGKVGWGERTGLRGWTLVSKAKGARQMGRTRNPEAATAKSGTNECREKGQKHIGMLG
jgi:hypothetical protein